MEGEIFSVFWKMDNGELLTPLRLLQTCAREPSELLCDQVTQAQTSINQGDKAGRE